MSVFEDLIDELKNENLLEDTVLDHERADAAAPDLEPDPTSQIASQAVEEVQDATAGDESLVDHDLPQIEKPSNQREFFRKRAEEEVSSLQMVQHVLSGVEREYLQATPRAFDDLNAKKALHKFLQVSGDLRSPEHAEAELALRSETETWSYALFERDQQISVANVRRFCEESRPVLSSQALIALARFYRNSPYSEDVRSKFDYVMTRLFSRETGEETRKPLFGHDEMIGHISTLYGNWSSIALYTREDDQIEVSLTITRFDEFKVEIENADSFDELLESGFFSRVRAHKEESAEMFYVPDVVAAAIRCNLAIGNRYVELIGRERTRASVEKIEEKYGEEYDHIVSDAAGKTLLLSDVLLIEPTFEEPYEEEGEAAATPAVAAAPGAKKVVAPKKERTYDVGVNKWLMVFCFVMLFVAGALYFGADRLVSSEDASAPSAKPLDLGDAEIGQFIRSPRSTKETMYAVTQPAFDSLDEEKQKEVLAKVQKFAASKRLNKVNLINGKGRTVAFASKDRFELVAQ